MANDFLDPAKQAEKKARREQEQARMLRQREQDLFHPEKRLPDVFNRVADRYFANDPGAMNKAVQAWEAHEKRTFNASERAAITKHIFAVAVHEAGIAHKAFEETAFDSVAGIYIPVYSDRTAAFMLKELASAKTRFEQSDEENSRQPGYVVPDESVGGVNPIKVRNLTLEVMAEDIRKHYPNAKP